ncbi:hypothetical protein C2G38_2066289 [Gigaspora rosea]|uniref:Uncharacterized protein n=1 Tax=Gigaspora rosea TaxID=44941 RepID=A0A397W0W3_9GLOM|nr:hypothetical protein C2G38_2066289 [Gigaspora rosea]
MHLCQFFLPVYASMLLKNSFIIINIVMNNFTADAEILKVEISIRKYKFNEI